MVIEDRIITVRKDVEIRWKYSGQNNCRINLTFEVPSYVVQLLSFIPRKNPQTCIFESSMTLET